MALIWRYPVVRDAGGRCVVVALHDGDTFRLLLDCGADAGVFPWLRLAGVYCPELNAPGGVEAAEFTATQLSKARAIEVTLEKIVRQVTSIEESFTLRRARA